MARTFEERKEIQEMWKDGAPAKAIAAVLGIPLSSLYQELKRGQDGSRQEDFRLRYSAALAQKRVQQAYESRPAGTRKKKGA